MTHTSLTIKSQGFFACDKLTTFTVSNTVTDIFYEERCFAKCSLLTSVPRITTAYDYSFIDCVKLVLPETISNPGTGSFMGLTAITTLKIIGATINKFAFMRCTNLKSVTLQDTDTISDSAFNGCSSLTSVTFPSKPIIINPYAFYGTALTTVDVSKATSIGAAAFQNTKLQTVTVGNNFPSQTLPENQPFYNLPTLTKIVLASSATQFYIEPFLLCENLAEITVNGNFKNTNGIITSSDDMKLICVLPTINISQYEIPDVETIQKYAFQSNQFITSATAYFPKTLSYTFFNCRNLTSFSYSPDASQTDPLQLEGTFMDCPMLKTVTLNGKIQSIGDDTFRNCVKLVDFVIPDSVTTIGQYSFANTQKIKNLTLNGVVTISSYAFYESHIRKLAIGKGLKTIGTYAFANSKISSINLPIYLSTIGDHAFYKAEKLTSITLPNIYEIKSNTFSGTSLTQINIPLSVHTIAPNAFDHIYSALKFSFPSGGHPKFTVSNDHEFIDKSTSKLLFTFGNLTKTYKISNSVKSLDINSINTNFYEQRNTGYAYDIGVQTLIIPAIVSSFDPSCLSSSSTFLRTLCFEGDITFTATTLSSTNIVNIFAPAYTGGSTQFTQGNQNIPIKRQPCDQTSPYPTSYQEINDTCPPPEEIIIPEPDNETNSSQKVETPAPESNSGFTPLAGWMVAVVIVLVIVIVGLIVLYLVNQKAKSIRREKRAQAKAEKLKQQQEALNKEQEPPKEQLDEETKQAVEAAVAETQQQTDQNAKQGEGDVEKTKDNPLLTFGDSNEDAFGDDADEPADSPLAQDDNKDNSDSSSSNSDGKELQDI